jgi:hypothetical protein
MLGSCGGRITYPAFSHLNGVTTATLLFDKYCTVDSATKAPVTVNGNIAFVDTGTPGLSGPIRSKIEAGSPDGISIDTQDAAGQPVKEVITFSNFVYTVGVPGGKPTASNPDQLSLGELKATNSSTQKTYRETDFKVSMFTPATGGQQFTVSGRGYRSGGEYFDVATSVPFVTDATGAPLGGAMTFTGAAGSTAVATVKPGSVMQATMTVNGTPLAGMPACK